jgi:hypothetical protein
MTSMTSAFTGVLLTALLALPGCSSQVVSSYRAPGADIQVQGLRVVFEDTALVANSKVPARENAMNQHRLLLGNSIVERLPEVLAADKLPASARTLPSAAIPSTRDFSAYFPPEQSAWHTLVVAPVYVQERCSGTCNYHFRLGLRLVEPRTRGVVWSATIEQPQMGGVGSHKAVYDYYADDIGKLVLKEIRR